ncbi:MAG: thioredoxin family protein [Chlamydiia bacterium]
MHLRVLFLFLIIFSKALSAKVPPLEAMEEKAIKEKKPLMIFFLGSGWCHWCDEMKRKILSKPDFIRNVEKNFIVIEVDFPRDGGKRKNEAAYKKRFEVGRYPTLVIYDPKTEKIFKESGFKHMAPAEYAAYVKEEFFGGSFWGISWDWGAKSEEEPFAYEWIQSETKKPPLKTEAPVRVGFSSSWIK